MKIKNLMSNKLITVKLDDDLAKIKEIFDNSNFHHLLVIENTKLFGVISDRDLLKSISPNVDTIAATEKDLFSLNKRAHQIMTRNPITINEDAAITEAVQLFNSNNISCIPVIDKNQKPVGIISWRDIIRLLFENIKKP
ncbi:MAG: CBS domain-containing protein [Cellvibrionaceae bacterium]